MKRKPTTKQTVRAELIRMVSALLTTARTTNYEHVCDSETDRARGAIVLALHADIIDTPTHTALCELAGNARYERQMELIYGQPPYTGSAFAEARRDAAKAAA
ncbi:hypothetical protein [Pseudomonas pseudonitroreducens]|uniref:hypothetical protein n=1 Tax=Pseudomonas pseudonitroreducens TaxID=2892326 RepID=UPI001F1AB4E8|nr:hypothetical protein [Pseudomonas pseudonitroreducens]